MARLRRDAGGGSLKNLAQTVFISAIVCVCVVRFTTVGLAPLSGSDEGSPIVVKSLQQLLQRVDESERIQKKQLAEIKRQFATLSTKLSALEGGAKEVKVVVPATQRTLAAEASPTVGSLPPISQHPPLAQVVVPSESLRKATATFHNKGVELSTSKVTLSAYDIPYAFFFEKYATLPVKVLEVGSRSDAASLKFWQAVLPKATIYADEGQANSAGGLDIIVSAEPANDGTWESRFKTMFPLLRSGGWYVIEGYEPNSESTKKLFQIVSVMHRMYLAAPTFTNFTVLDYVDHEIKSMHFYEQIIFIEKGEPNPRWDRHVGKWDATKFPPGNLLDQITEPRFNTALGMAGQKDWLYFVDRPYSAFSSPHNKWLLTEIERFHHDIFDDKVQTSSAMCLLTPTPSLRSKTTKTKMMEIGIAAGNSIRLWDRYFPNLDYHGVDIAVLDAAVEAARSVNAERKMQKMKVHEGDQGNRTSLQTLAVNAGARMDDDSTKFDLIIDDGSHASYHHIVTLNALYPYLKNGGIYVIEDMAASGWAECISKMEPYEFESHSCSLAKCIGIVQLINAMHPSHSSVYSKFDAELNAMFRSISFYDQMVILQKGSPNPRFDSAKGEWDASTFPKVAPATKLPSPLFNAAGQGKDWISRLKAL